MASPLMKAQAPVCSVERARELGLDVSKVPTCHPEKTNGVRGCSQWNSCRFHLPHFGGFKGNGPKMVGYYLRPFDGPPKTDICACSTFVMALQPLMDELFALRQQGKNGQVVRVVAQEGQPIKVKRFPQKVVNGQRVTEMKVEEVKVPKFPDPTEQDGWMEYENDIMAQYESEMAAEVGMPEPDPLDAPMDEVPGGPPTGAPSAQRVKR